VNTDASAQATVDAHGGDSRPGLSPGWVVVGATILDWRYVSLAQG
jgi:hypothetical protein